MAILQSTLAEEVLSRQERFVVRGIYRASQLAEALIVLEKMTPLLTERTAQAGQTKAEKQAKLVKEYLTKALAGALTNIKVPEVLAANSSSTQVKVVE